MVINFLKLSLGAKKLILKNSTNFIKSANQNNLHKIVISIHHDYITFNYSLDKNS